MVECHFAKVNAIGSNPIIRSSLMVMLVLAVSTQVCGSWRVGSNPTCHPNFGNVAQSVEHGLHTAVVGGSNPSIATKVLED